MSFRDNMARDLNVILNPDEFADIVTYHHKDGDSKIKAIYLSKNEIKFDREAGVDTTTPSLLVKAIDVPDVKYGSKFTFRDTVYEVSYIPTEDDLPLSANNSDLLRLYISIDTKSRF